MLEFVETLTLAPWEASDRDWSRLTEVGMHPLEIAQVVLGCAHFNYLNRMADGLGIPVEYGGVLEPYQQGLGTERREERTAAPPASAMAAASSPLESRLPIDASLVSRLVVAGQAEPAPRDLVAALSFNEALARGVIGWRAFQLRGTSILDAPLRAKIALFAAAVEFCGGAARHARERALALGVTAKDVAALEEGDAPAVSSERDRLVLTQVRRLMQSPASTTRDHVDALRREGFDDREVVRLTMLAAYLSFEHRVRCGLLA